MGGFAVCFCHKQQTTEYEGDILLNQHFWVLLIVCGQLADNISITELTTGYLFVIENFEIIIISLLYLKFFHTGASVWLHRFSLPLFSNTVFFVQFIFLFVFMMGCDVKLTLVLVFSGVSTFTTRFSHSRKSYKQVDLIMNPKTPKNDHLIIISFPMNSVLFLFLFHYSLQSVISLHVANM